MNKKKTERFLYVPPPPFPFSFEILLCVLSSNTTQIVITHICVIFSKRMMSVNLLNGPSIYRSTDYSTVGNGGGVT
jgi:hypothetical protein